MLKLSSEFLDYLVAAQQSTAKDAQFAAETPRLPSLGEMSKVLGISVASLREQLEVAKAIGLVVVHPRTGIRCLPYTFLPAVRQSLSFAIAVDWSNFVAYSDLRNHIEASYWDEAARALTIVDHEQLKALISQALNKLNGTRIQIPHQEHRLLHLTVFSKLKNPFVIGLLEAYWEVYEAVGLNLYEDYNYLQQVWSYHQQMVDAIIAKDFDTGYRALVQHKELLFHRPGAWVMSGSLVSHNEKKSPSGENYEES